jgi:integrase
MVKRAVGALSMILNAAMARGMVAQNVALAGRRKRGKADARHEELIEEGRAFPSMADVQRLIEAAPARWKPLLMTAAFTGLRSSELRGLRWANVDLDRRMLRVRQQLDRWNEAGSPKSKAGRRDVPLSGELVAVLREWRLACPIGEAGLVFPNSLGKPDTHSNLDGRFWRPLQRRVLGEVRFNFHALRHFAVSAMIHMGLPPKRIQTIIGHSTLAMTMDTYGHLFPMKDSDFARLDAIFDRVMGATKPAGEVVPLARAQK